jgi:hypothetical protein
VQLDGPLLQIKLRLHRTALRRAKGIDLYPDTLHRHAFTSVSHKERGCTVHHAAQPFPETWELFH